MTLRETALFLDVSKICRICLTENGNMRSLFSEVEESDSLQTNSLRLSEILSNVTNCNVNQNDGLPSLLCSFCETLLQHAFKFKQTFERSCKILQQYLSEYCYNVKELITENNVASPDFIDCDSSVADNFIESVVKSQQLHYKGHENNQFELSNSKIVLNSIKSNCDAEFSEVNNELKDNIVSNEFNNSKTNLKVVKRNCGLDSTEVDIDSDNELKNDTVSSIKTLHPCPICTKEFYAEELREHVKSHKALKKYLTIRTSIKASTKFYAKSSTARGVVTLHRRPQKLHKCISCNTEFTARELRIHIQTHKNQNEFKCDQCERVFKKLNHLNTHRVKHLKEYPFKCEYCEKGFVIKKNYECHVLTHNVTQELPHECRCCLKRFSNPEHLNRHMFIHTENITYSVKYKVSKCYQCLKTFKDKEALKSHKCVPLEHSVNVRSLCKACNKVFKNSSSLYNHNRNIHKQKGSSKMLCSVCGKRVSSIYTHMMRHTGERPFQCNECNKRFIGKPQLRQHLLVHSGLKPFVCSVCAKAFNNLYNLQVHERIHKGDRSHICSICKKGFLEKSYLKKHMQVHSKS